MPLTHARLTSKAKYMHCDLSSKAEKLAISEFSKIRVAQTHLSIRYSEWSQEHRYNFLEIIEIFK